MLKKELEKIYVSSNAEDLRIFNKNEADYKASSEKGRQRIRDNMPVFDANPSEGNDVMVSAASAEKLRRATVKIVPTWWKGYPDPAQMPISDCRELVNRMFEVYRRASRYIQINEELGTSRGNMVTDQEIVRMIELIVESMRSDYRLIICREYMSCPEPQWYSKYYTRSTFYRLRDEAVREFLRCIRQA